MALAKGGRVNGKGDCALHPPHCSLHTHRRGIRQPIHFRGKGAFETFRLRGIGSMSIVNL